MNEQLTIEEQTRLIQVILHDNHDYPNTVVKQKDVPYIPFKTE